MGFSALSSRDKNFSASIFLHQKDGRRKFSPHVSASPLAGCTQKCSFRTRLVHRNGPACELLAVQGGHGSFAFRVVAHGHKRESSRLAGISIVYDASLFDGAKLFEDILKIGFGRIE